MRKAKNLTGQKFGRLTARAYISRGRRSVWVCICECGGEVEATSGNLLSGNTQSCGCLRKETTIARSTTHGLRDCAEYMIWHYMKKRCQNRRDKAYRHYGGRGIAVCARWGKFDNFYADMGSRPSPQHSIERIDNNAGYAPENCQWATKKEQARNKRNSHLITYDGRTMCVTDWAAELGIGQPRLSTLLLKRKMTMEEIVAYIRQNLAPIR